MWEVGIEISNFGLRIFAPLSFVERGEGHEKRRAQNSIGPIILDQYEVRVYSSSGISYINQSSWGHIL